MSLVLLNEIAGLCRETLMMKKEFIVLEAGRLGIPISLESRLSPFRYPTSPPALRVRTRFVRRLWSRQAELGLRNDAFCACTGG